MSAGTPYHYVHGPNGTFLGVLKIAPAQRAALAGIAERLAGMVDGDLPDGWQAELDQKADRWKLALHRRARRALLDPQNVEDTSDEALEAADDEELVAGEIELGPAEAAELERRVAAAASDVPSLLLCGLVRSDVQVGGTHLRKLFWTRPLTDADVARARARMGEYDEDKALLDSAVKASDGFFTTFFVSPYSQLHRALGGQPRLDAERRHHALGVHRACSPRRRSPPASAGAWSPAPSCSSSRSRSTASTASSPATRARSRSWARGWTRSSTARRSTSSSPASRSARRAPATTCGCSPAPR